MQNKFERANFIQLNKSISTGMPHSPRESLIDVPKKYA